MLTSSKKTVFLNQDRIWGRNIPMIEVKLDLRESAFKIRNIFVTKKKEGEYFGWIHIANSACLATRIRVDILLVFCKTVWYEGDKEMFVSAFSSHPVLHIQSKSGNQRPYALTFADAVWKYVDLSRMTYWGPAGTALCSA
jgi:hypothetical protein